MKKSACNFECGNCGEPETKKDGMNVCARCRRVRYCTRSCQAAHWKTGHKKFCIKPEACKPGDQPLEDRAAEVQCVICLGTTGETFYHGSCSALIHSACLAGMYKHSGDKPSCPGCRQTLPSMVTTLKFFVDDGNLVEFNKFVGHLEHEGIDVEPIACHMGRYLYEKSHLDAAIKMYETFTRVSKSKSPYGHMAAGAIYHSKKDNLRAECEFRKGVLLAPDRDSTHLCLATFLMKIMNPREDPDVGFRALEAVNRCLELNPSEDAFIIRAGIHYKMGAWAQALEDARTVLSLNCDQKEARVFCSTLLALLGLEAEEDPYAVLD